MASSLAIKNLLTVFSPEGEFRTKYSWLLSDWTENRWEVRDPGSDSNASTIILIFDGLIAPNSDFSDYPQIVEDIKRSLVLSIELGRLDVSTGSVVNSLNGMRHHVNALKRAYRELFDMRLESINKITSNELILLKARLALPEHASMDYPNRLDRYLSQFELAELPIKIHQARKMPASVNLDLIRTNTGILKDVMRHCEESRNIINKINLGLSEYYPQYTWSLNQPSSTDNPRKPASSNIDHLTSMFRALQRFFLQSEIIDVFNYPLKLNPIDKTAKTDAEELIERASTRERTRNIPAKPFLMLMDRAVRWVVDYSDELFELENISKSKFSEFSAEFGDEEAGKLTGGWVRRYQSDHSANSKASPFPLAGYKQGGFKTGGSKYSDEMLESINELLEQGVSRKSICSDYGFTKATLEGIVSKISDHRYSRNIDTSGISLNEALYSFLPLCCSLILLSFTAGRESAVYKLKAGCVSHVLGSRYINMYVPKTSRDYEEFPTVALVEKAVQVLEKLSSKARSISGRDELFQFCDLVNRDSPKGFRFDDVVARFLNFIEFPKDNNGQHFKFSEHQFRRFFAIMYFYRFDDGDYESLAYFLRHTDWSMTERYLTEKESGKIFKELEKERGAEFAIRASLGDRVSGAMAEEFRIALGDSFKLETEKRFQRALKHVNDHSLVMDFVPQGVCFGRTPGKQIKSKCLLEVDGEVHVMIHRATEYSCDGCPNLLSCDEVRQNYEFNGRLESAIQCSSPILDAVLERGAV